MPHPRPPHPTDRRDGRRSELVEGLDAVLRVLPEVDGLAADTDAPASMRASALSAYLRHRPRVDCFAVLVRRADLLVGAAVLTLVPATMGRHIVKAGIPGEPYRLLYRDLAAAEELADALVAAFGAVERGWRVRLSDLPSQDPCVDALVRRSRYVEDEVAAHTPCLDVGPGSQLSTLLSRNVRNACSKAANRIAHGGHELQLRWTADEAGVEAALPRLVDVHIRRNEQLRGFALLAVDYELATYLDVVRGHAAAGRVRLLETVIDGRLAAFALCIASGRRLWAYSNYADPDWLDVSPGTLCNAEVVRYAHADPEVDTLDWGAGVQRYKLSGGAFLASTREVHLWQRRHHALLSKTRREVRRLSAAGRSALAGAR